MRNSGIKAVVEGVGDHGCEYMTGGTVAVIGSCGRNFAAGMSGGVAYVYDKDSDFKEKCNMGLVEFDRMSKKDKETLKTMLERHAEYTGSETAKAILDNFSTELKKFVKVIPTDYKKVSEIMDEETAKGADADTAMLTAFESVTGKKTDIA